MHEVADVGLRVLGRSALTVRTALLAVPLLLIATGLLLGSAPQRAFAAPELDGVDAGGNHTCSVVSAVVYCWGRNVDGRIGDGSGIQRTTAVPVDGSGVLAGLRMTRISGGGTHTCGLSSVGRAYCWGEGSGGQLGDGAAVRRNSPVAVDAGGALAGVTLTRISAGAFHTCALSSAGRAYCWGDGGDGRIGDGATVTRTNPVPVRAGAVTLVDVSAGRSHTCAVSSAGGVFCWGSGAGGRLGNGRTRRAPVPVPVDTSGALSGVTVVQVTAGANHTCALSSAGQAYCWGRNASGQLGDGSTEGSTVPVPVDTSGVLAGVSLTQIAAGANHTCALSSAGAAYCWGANADGQIGDGGTDSRPGPVAVDTGTALSGVRLRRITAGANHSCAASATVVYCWGLNSYGQLGDGSTTGRTVPVRAGVRTPPGPPTAVIATAGDGRARVSWRAPADGTVTAYRVTASPGAVACTSSTTSCVVTGLVNGTAYTFSVVAAGPDGSSGASAPSQPVTPFALPGAPTDVTVTAGDERVTLTWSAPADGGTGGVVGYTVRAVPGGAGCWSETTSCRVTGLTNGTGYTFTVVARNAYGMSVPSVESDPVTPVAAPAPPTPIKDKGGTRAPPPPSFAPEPPVRVVPATEAPRRPEPVRPRAADEYDLAPPWTAPEPATPEAAPPALPDVRPEAPPPADAALAGSAAGSTTGERPAGATQVGAVLVGMGLLVFIGTAAFAYLGRRRARRTW